MILRLQLCQNATPANCLYAVQTSVFWPLEFLVAWIPTPEVYHIFSPFSEFPPLNTAVAQYI